LDGEPVSGAEAVLDGARPAQGHPPEGGRPDEVSMAAPAAIEGAICCGHGPGKPLCRGVLSRSQSL
jgi:hypothetical protein